MDKSCGLSRHQGTHFGIPLDDGKAQLSSSESLQLFRGGAPLFKLFVLLNEFVFYRAHRMSKGASRHRGGAVVGLDYFLFIIYVYVALFGTDKARPHLNARGSEHKGRRSAAAVSPAASAARAV